jgi:DNA-binding phage protein
LRISSSKSDGEVLSGFLANDLEDGNELRKRFDSRLIGMVGSMPAALAGLGLEEDVLQRTWELVYRAGANGYQPERGGVLAYLEGHARNARRDVCAAHAPPGQPTRPRKDEDGMTIPWKPTVPLEAGLVTEAGKEVALVNALATPVDEVEHAIDGVFVDELMVEAARLGEVLVVELLGQMREDRGLSEAAAEVGVTRFAGRRALDRFAGALASAA